MPAASSFAEFVRTAPVSDGYSLRPSRSSTTRTHDPEHRRAAKCELMSCYVWESATTRSFVNAAFATPTPARGICQMSCATRFGQTLGGSRPATTRSKKADALVTGPPHLRRATRRCSAPARSGHRRSRGRARSRQLSPAASARTRPKRPPCWRKSLLLPRRGLPPGYTRSPQERSGAPCPPSWSTASAGTPLGAVHRRGCNWPGQGKAAATRSTRHCCRSGQDPQHAEEVVRRDAAERRVLLHHPSGRRGGVVGPSTSTRPATARSSSWPTLTPTRPHPVPARDAVPQAHAATAGGGRIYSAVPPLHRIELI